MQRNQAFRERFKQYEKSLTDLSAALNGYLTPGRHIRESVARVETTALAYFEISESLSGEIHSLEEDGDSTRALLAMVGIDLIVARQAAAIALHTGETDEMETDAGALAPNLGDGGRADIVDLGPVTARLRADIGGTTLPIIRGGSGDAQQGLQPTVEPSIRQILRTAGEDLEATLHVGASAILGVIGTSQAKDLWAAAAQRVDALFKRRGLWWVAGKALEAARNKARLLVKINGGIPNLVKDLSDRAGSALVATGLAAGLSGVLDAKEVVRDCDGRLRSLRSSEDQAVRLQAAEKVVLDHREFRWWMPLVTGTGRLLSGAPIPVPGKRQLLLLCAVVLVAVSAWAAGAYIGSSRVPDPIKFGVRSLPSVI
jgi:hypothetical protein